MRRFSLGKLVVSLYIESVVQFSTKSFGIGQDWEDDRLRNDIHRLANQSVRQHKDKDNIGL